ncbi:MAG: sulfatase [Candidatus Sumerlaeia bacterium]
MKPNVLFINTHDTGRHLHCYGVESVRSPRLDQLASEGCLFTNYFTVSTLCSPSRGASMTGRYPQHNGMLGLCHGAFGWRLNEGERHISHLFHDAGYYTILLGHQHETVDIDRDLCFDDHGAHHAPTAQGHLPCDGVADAAVEFLKSDAAQKAPFYFQLGFFETHRPFDFGEAEEDREKGVDIPEFLVDNEASREEFALFQGNIKKVDHHIGRVLDALKEAGLEENTLVLYTTDHGVDFPRAKTTLHDPGMEIALMMRWPGHIASGQKCDWLLSNVDLLPTILDFAGIDKPDNLDGISFAGFEKGGDSPRKIHFAFQQAHTTGKEIRCARTESHKFLRNFEHWVCPTGPVNLATIHDKYYHKKYSVPKVQLYDMEKDPHEWNDVADDPAYADVREQLDATLWAWLEEMDDPILKGPIVTPFYEKSMADYKGAKA